MTDPPYRADPEVKEAFRALYRLTPDQRAQVLCWFCSQCHKYVGPGESCPHPEPVCYFCGRNKEE